MTFDGKDDFAEFRSCRKTSRRTRKPAAWHPATMIAAAPLVVWLNSPIHAFLAGCAIALLTNRRPSPAFILAFLSVAALGSIVVLPTSLIYSAGILSQGLLTTALFLVGTELTRSTVKRIRGRILLHGCPLASGCAHSAIAGAVDHLMPRHCFPDQFTPEM